MFITLLLAALELRVRTLPIPWSLACGTTSLAAQDACGPALLLFLFTLESFPPLSCLASRFEALAANLTRKHIDQLTTHPAWSNTTSYHSPCSCDSLGTQLDRKVLACPLPCNPKVSVAATCRLQLRPAKEGSLTHAPARLLYLSYLLGGQSAWARASSTCSPSSTLQQLLSTKANGREEKATGLSSPWAIILASCRDPHYRTRRPSFTSLGHVSRAPCK